MLNGFRCYSFVSQTCEAGGRGVGTNRRKSGIEMWTTGGRASSCLPRSVPGIDREL